MTYRNGNYESSGLDNWMTPRHIIEELENEFGELFDPCPAYHDDSFNGLEISWPRDKVCFVNPPYSRKLKEEFVKKAILESKKGKLCVLLLPVSTSTVLFHDYILPNKKEIRFVRGRLQFAGVNTKGLYVDNVDAMHDSMIVIFKK